jgi:hypothetical protein
LLSNAEIDDVGLEKFSISHRGSLPEARIKSKVTAAEQQVGRHCLLTADTIIGIEQRR